jgi:hypothetical protein
MKQKYIILAAIGLLTAGTLFTGCKDDDDDNMNANAGKPNVYFLNEGAYQKNNSDITAYQSDSNKVYSNYFLKANSIKLGDTGQDIITYNGDIYIAVSTSQVIYRIDRSGKKLASVNTTSNPRSLTVKDGHLYAACYGGKLLKLDATTLSKQDSIVFDNGNTNLEGSVISGNMLYVANSYSVDASYNYTYHENLYTVNLSTFKKGNDVAIYSNPNTMYLVNGNIYVLCIGNYADKGSELVRLDVSTNKYEIIAPALRMAAYKDVIYFANSVTDWSTYATTTSFGSYDTNTGKVNATSFLQDAPKSFATTSIYMLTINPYNGDFYIAPADYSNTGTIYRFTKEGKLQTSFDAGGVNPSKAIFF